MRVSVSDVIMPCIYFVIPILLMIRLVESGTILRGQLGDFEILKTDVSQKFEDSKRNGLFLTHDTIFRDKGLDDSNNNNKLNKILWSPSLERSCTRQSLDSKQNDRWRHKVLKCHVVKMEPGCGRMQNRLLTLDDGTLTCARYRQNTEQIQGEMFSYFLSQLLGIQNTLSTVLLNVQHDHPRWTQINTREAEWADNKLVVLTPFISGLKPAFIPKEFQNMSSVLNLEQDLSNKSDSEMCDLVQWSDLIVFDYLTANLDRLVNNLHNLQWNPSMMSAPAHNLEKSSTSGALVFLDNESGLFHGYRLLEKYSHYHDSVLKHLCIFNESTVSRIEKLKSRGNTGLLMNEMLKSAQMDGQSALPKMLPKNQRILQQRIDNIYKQIKFCEGRYANS